MRNWEEIHHKRCMTHLYITHNNINTAAPDFFADIGDAGRDLVAARKLLAPRLTGADSTD